MDIRYLETLLAVADGGSVAAAARAQGLTATSVTQRLRALEADLGAKLAVRIGREVKLTATAERLLPQVRQIAAEAKNLVDSIEEDQEGALSGSLHVGAIATALTGLLPKVIGSWASNHPGMELRVSPGTSAALYDGLLEGSYDAIISVAPPFSISKVIKTTVLRREPLVCLAPQALITATEENPSEQDLIAGILGGERFIRYDASSWGGRLAEAYLRDRDIRVREFCEMDALEAIAIMVDQGVGVALVPDWAPPWPSIPHCRKLPIEASSYSRTLVLLHHRNARRSRALDVLTKDLTS